MLDKDNNFVPGLVADDLALFEDGKPQTIQQFYMVTHDSSARNPVAGAGVNAAQSAEDRAHRVFVLLFDEGSLGNESLMRVKKGAEQFIEEQIGPGDIGGVFVAGNMYRSRLTTDKNELIMAVRSVRPTFDNRQALLAPLREFPRIPSEVDAARIESGEREVAAQLAEKACTDEPALCAGYGAHARYADRRGREPDPAESAPVRAAVEDADQRDRAESRVRRRRPGPHSGAQDAHVPDGGVLRRRVARDAPHGGGAGRARRHHDLHDRRTRQHQRHERQPRRRARLDVALRRVRHRRRRPDDPDVRHGRLHDPRHGRHERARSA